MLVLVMPFVLKINHKVVDGNVMCSIQHRSGNDTEGPGKNEKANLEWI